jgi:SAM-dependent methyltransferase
MEIATMQQDKIFLDHEGDNWFDRNSTDIYKKITEFDFPTYLIDLLEHKDKIKTVAELGCSNGWRLQKLHEKFPSVKFSGIDASSAAIEDGKTKYPHIELHQGLLAKIPLLQQYDIVIIFFVFSWVDRSSLAKSIAEVDRLVKDSGLLIIGDFAPDFPQRRHYHHLPEQSVFTYKQDYPAIFESLCTYREITKFSGNHDKAKEFVIEPCDSENRFSCSVLHKSNTGYYCEL